MTPYLNTSIPSIPSDLKHQNRRTVLSFFTDNCEHTAAEIAAATGISKLTVMRAIQFFCDKGILTSSGKGRSTERGGKRPACFCFSYDKYTLNITMWPDSLCFTLFKLNHTVVRRESLRWLIPSTPDEAFSLMGAYALDFLSRSGVTVHDLYGVNLSTAGIVDYENLVLRYSSHSPNWGTDTPVGDYLRQIFGPEPFYFAENSGKCIGRAIYAKQADQSKRTLVLFTSWGISAALIRDGQILNGRDSIIGEIGHMILDPYDKEPCSCGSCGCAERLLSVSRLIRDISADPPPASSPLSSLSPSLLSLSHVFTASHQGDPYARARVRVLADRFADLLRNTALSFDPELVIVVGDYAAADAYFDACLKERLSGFRYFASGNPFALSYDQSPLPQLDADGGAIAMLEHFISQSFLYEEPMQPARRSPGRERPED